MSALAIATDRNNVTGFHLSVVDDHLASQQLYQTAYPVTAVEHTRMPGLHHPAHLGKAVTR